ncbi:sulfatase family protein [Pelagicoccus mobilis]|uniref:Sulfatase n=1 Tax=Pelagicoccus mobilis TaxID=415221 RepID=A0A934RUV7_9BACT|nr:sulfatase [Pelagicoccus mobilis]MBK1876881.1 sulfatase [Pelagicoccus mobilis]
MMKIKRKLAGFNVRALILLLVLSFGEEARIWAKSERPNIVFILIDDQRYDFLSFLDHPWIETPRIDELASHGMYFDQAFVTTSLCSPSRASIVTGVYAHTHGVIDNDTPVPENLDTFPKELQKGGYHTGFVGKWHMGGSNDMPRPGFDYWASFRGQGPYNDPEMNIDGEVYQKKGYTPDVLTDLAVEFIEEQTQSDKPYFLYLSHKSIHEDFTPARRHAGRYSDLEIPLPESFGNSEANYAGKPDWLKKQRVSWHGAERDYGILDYGSFDRFFQLYSECMLGVDESVGRIADTLERLGELDNTVIIYFSDNGYLIGEHGLIDKRVMYEESIRVPAFIHWPSKIKEASVNSEFVLNVDLGPTILDIAGIGTPESMHGESFLPLIEGESDGWRQDFVYEYFIDPNAVQTPTIFGLRTKDYSYMTYHGVWDLFELYDMQKDPNQRNNLLGEVDYGWGYGGFLKYTRQQLPEVYPTVKRLDNRLTELMEELGGSRNPSWKLAD